MQMELAFLIDADDATITVTLTRIEDGVRLETKTIPVHGGRTVPVLALATGAVAAARGELSEAGVALVEVSEDGIRVVGDDDRDDDPFAHVDIRA